MFESNGLVVSVPANELAEIILPGSFFNAGVLLSNVISTTLRAAVQMLCDVYAGSNRQLLFVARPEIFTNGASRVWLDERLGNIEDHLCISDGSVIHIIPGLRNHLFFYDLGLTRNVAGLKRLIARAPEIPAELASQINSAITFRAGAARCTPRPVLLQAASLSYLGDPEFYAFYLNPNSVEDSINRMRLAPPLARAALADFQSAIYVPFTERAADDADFCRHVARLIIESVQAPAQLLLLGAPLAQSRADIAVKMIALLLQGLRNCGTILPRAVLPNVVVVSTLLGSDYFMPPHPPATLLMPESFPFWRCPKSYFRLFQQVELAVPVSRRRDDISISEFFAPALGAQPRLLWTGPELHASTESEFPHG